MRPRHGLWAVLLFAVAGTAPGQPAAPVPLSMEAAPALTPDNQLVFEAVVAEAQTLATRPYQGGPPALPEPLRELERDAYEDIRPRPERGLWHGERLFEARFHHRGFVYRDRVRIHEVVDGAIREVPFSPDRFHYDGQAAALAERVPGDLGFAGLTLHFPLNRPGHKDPVVGFLGASYFRLLARGQVTGLSARGLAVDTGTATGEEFPRFTDFWLLRPAPDAARITLLALLDSPSITGAYRFDVIPGARTRVLVDARLFARQDIGKLGVAPLTGTFLHGEHTNRAVDDVRPEVHDADGLVLLTNAGERVWRPLVNPPRLRVSALQAGALQGFGLLQRDRDPAHYLDREAAFERRPSYWVEPLGEPWGEGSVELLEIPSLSEVNDNITAYWRTDDPPAAGESRRYRYRLTAFSGERGTPLGRVLRTRVGWAGSGSGADPPRAHRRFLVDFAGGDLEGLNPRQPVRAVVTSSSGDVRDVQTTPVPEQSLWRVGLRLVPEGGAAADLRLHLTLRGERVSETWNYVWYPQERP